jgi:hypothetical protein
MAALPDCVRQASAPDNDQPARPKPDLRGKLPSRKQKSRSRGKTPVSGFSFLIKQNRAQLRRTDPTTRWHFSSSEGCKRPQIPMPKFYFAAGLTASRQEFRPISSKAVREGLVNTATTTVDGVTMGYAPYARGLGGGANGV